MRFEANVVLILLLSSFQLAQDQSYRNGQTSVQIGVLLAGFLGFEHCTGFEFLLFHALIYSIGEISRRRHRVLDHHRLLEPQVLTSVVLLRSLIRHLPRKRNDVKRLVPLCQAWDLPAWSFQKALYNLKAQSTCQIERRSLRTSLVHIAHCPHIQTGT